jgi:hypothetical protein
MTNYYDTDFAALDAVEDAIEAYATARYGAPPPVLARIRANVMAEAAAAAATLAAQRALVGDTDVSAPPAWTIGRLRLPVFQVPRRAFALGLAGAMMFGTSAAVFAAPPGSPFYNARVAIETALLPNELDARLAAHEQHIQDRLTAAEDAVIRGDYESLAAALAAYQAEVDAAVADVGDDPARLVHLEEMLAKHVTVLTALEARLPEQAAIENALENSQKAIVRIKNKGNKGNGGTHGGKPSDTPGGRPSIPPGQVNTDNRRDEVPGQAE